MIGRVIEFLVIRVLARVFPKRFRLILNAVSGAPLLRQFRIFSWLYLQSFVGPEARDWFHVHRWAKMFSIVLSGGFIEERYPGGRGFFIHHRAPSCYGMDYTTIHRIKSVSARAWTLFFMLRDRGEGWGYYPRVKITPIPFQDFIPAPRKVTSL